MKEWRETPIFCCLKLKLIILKLNWQHWTIWLLNDTKFVTSSFMDLYEFWDDFTWATEGSQQVEVGDVAAARGATCSVHRYPHKVQMLSETKVNVIIHNSEFWKKKIFEFLFPAHWLSDWTEVVTWRKKLEKLFPPFWLLENCETNWRTSFLSFFYCPTVWWTYWDVGDVPGHLQVSTVAGLRLLAPFWSKGYVHLFTTWLHLQLVARCRLGTSSSGRSIVKWFNWLTFICYLNFWNI